MKKKGITGSLKNMALIILFIGVLGELLFFPSWENFAGCLMTIVVFWIFSFYLNQELIEKNFFSFLMLTTLFLYRFLPLFATLLEGKPITYGFELVYETFLFDTLLFGIGCLAFSLAKNKNLNKNNLQNVFLKIGLFKITPQQIWFLGFFGFVAKIYTLDTNNIVEGGIVIKFMQGLTYLAYAPILLLFPNLINFKKNISKRLPIFYLIFISIINLGTNSREELLTPVFLYVILFILSIIIEKKKLTDVISAKRLIIFSICGVLGFNLISNISLAMLKVRGVRKDIGRVELIEETLKTLQNEEQMNQLRSIANQVDGEIAAYDKGWSETYIDNFILNRYANIRLSDRTLDLAHRVGYENDAMNNYYWNRLLVLLPSPILDILNIKIDKSDMQPSPGDMLYGLGQSGVIRTKKIVASHIGVGLSIFGYSFFLWQLIVWYLIFKLLNALIVFTNENWTYSIFGLIQASEFLGFLRNSGGIVKDSGFLFRGFWEGIFTFLVCLYISKKITQLIPKSRQEI